MPFQMHAPVTALVEAVTYILYILSYLAILHFCTLFLHFVVSYLLPECNSKCIKCVLYLALIQTICAH